MSVHLFVGCLRVVSCVCPSHKQRTDRCSHGTLFDSVCVAVMNTNHPQSALSISLSGKYNRNVRFFRHVYLCPFPTISVAVTVFRYNQAALPRIRIPSSLAPQHAKTNMEHLSGQLPNAPARWKHPLYRRRHLFSYRDGLPSHKIQVLGARAARDSEPTASYRRCLEPRSHLCRCYRRAHVVRTLTPFLRSRCAG